MTDKPPYAVPPMAEIADLPWNGLNVISTFAGCGGSSLGYRMAGYRVLLANEFVPAAADVYALNAAPHTIVDRRDIREVSGLDFLAAVGLGVGELDVLDGSPPCASFSVAGKRSKGWGQVSAYSDTEQRTDDLFYEYARLVGEMQPRVFVAENVQGLVTGAAKGYFKAIHKTLAAQGYRVQAKLLNAQWLGVPQSRSRLIFMGVREDLGRDPVFPTPLPYRYSMSDALPHLRGQVRPLSSDGEAWATDGHVATDTPSATLGASPQTGNGRFPPSVVAELVARHAFDSSGPIQRQGVDDASPTIMAHGLAVQGAHQAVLSVRGLNGGTRHRDADEPMMTITATGAAGTDNSAVSVSADGLQFDPETGKDLVRGVSPTLRGRLPDERLRQLSLVEVRALCSFPADFQLLGNYSRRWERLGRAVPPIMMRSIARSVSGVLCAD